MRPSSAHGKTLGDRLSAWFKQHGLSGQRCAVAVSGGADSLALALLMKQALAGIHLHAFTVDHGLRHGSSAEARWTKAQLEARGIQCDILVADLVSTQNGNTQARARNARYVVLANACLKQNYHVLCTAHTLEDQAETFLARVARASGTKGLGAMEDVGSIPITQNASDALVLARPLLWARRGDLRQYLKHQRQRWAEDPSNANTAYDRIRLRRLLKDWEASGFSIDRIAGTAENMQRSNDALEFYAEQAQRETIQAAGPDALIIDVEPFFELPQDTQLRCLSTSLQQVSGNARTIRLVKLTDALEKLKTDTKIRFTLHGCMVKRNGSSIHVAQEHI